MTEDINSDEPTKDLTEDMLVKMSDSEKLNWLVETLQRFMARDTNPLPPNYDARFAALETEVREIRAEQRRFGHKLDKLASDLL